MSRWQVYFWNKQSGCWLSARSLHFGNDCLQTYWAVRLRAFWKGQGNWFEFSLIKLRVNASCGHVVNFICRHRNYPWEYLYINLLFENHVCVCVSLTFFKPTQRAWAGFLAVTGMWQSSSSGSWMSWAPNSSPRVLQKRSRRLLRTIPGKTPQLHHKHRLYSINNLGRCGPKAE